MLPTTWKILKITSCFVVFYDFFIDFKKMENAEGTLFPLPCKWLFGPLAPDFFRECIEILYYLHSLYCVGNHAKGYSNLLYGISNPSFLFIYFHVINMAYSFVPPPPPSSA